MDEMQAKADKGSVKTSITAGERGLGIEREQERIDAEKKASDCGSDEVFMRAVIISQYA